MRKSHTQEVQKITYSGGSENHILRKFRKSHTQEVQKITYSGGSENHILRRFRKRYQYSLLYSIRVTK